MVVKFSSMMAGPGMSCPGCEIGAAIDIGGAKALAEIGAPLFGGRRGAPLCGEPAAEMRLGNFGGGDQAHAGNFRRFAVPVVAVFVQSAVGESAPSSCATRSSLRERQVARAAAAAAASTVSDQFCPG